MSDQILLEALSRAATERDEFRSRALNAEHSLSVANAKIKDLERASVERWNATFNAAISAGQHISVARAWADETHGDLKA